MCTATPLVYYSPHRWRGSGLMYPGSTPHVCWPAELLEGRDVKQCVQGINLGNIQKEKKGFQNSSAKSSSNSLIFP